MCAGHSRHKIQPAVDDLAMASVVEHNEANLMEDFGIQHESHILRKTEMRPTWRLSHRIREIRKFTDMIIRPSHCNFLELFLQHR
jgi:hypothetical protein